MRTFSGSTFSPYLPAAMSATSCARAFFAPAMPTPIFLARAGVNVGLHYLFSSSGVVRSQLVMTRRPLSNALPDCLGIGACHIDILGQTLGQGVI